MFLLDSDQADITVSTEGTINAYYRAFGIRAVGQMVTLIPNDITKFELPFNTTLHAGIRGIGDLGLSIEDDLLLNLGRRILVDFVWKYENAVGEPITVSRPIQKEIKDFLKRNRGLTWVQHSRAWVKTETVPFIINYAGIEATYRYRERQGIELLRTVNFFNTVIDTVVHHLKTTQRNQFLHFDTPENLPSKEILARAESQLIKNAGKEIPLDLRERRVFERDGHFLLLQLWLWVGEHPELSLFSKIPKDQLKRTYLLTANAGRFTVLNLNTLFNWIKTEDNANASLSHSRAQLLMLRHFMSLCQMSSVSDDTIIVDEESVLELENRQAEKTDLSATLATDSEYKSLTPADPVLKVNIDASRVNKGKTLNVNVSKKEDTIVDTPVKLDNEEDFLFDQMVRDVEQLSTVYAQQEVDDVLDSENVYKEYTPKEVTFKSKIIDTAESLAGQGLFTAAEVRRAHTLASKFEKIQSPFDPSVTLSEYIKIDPETLSIGSGKLSEKTIEGVLDKSMLNSSTKEFTKRYINDVMYKDIANSVMHFQKAGIAVTNMDVQRNDGLLGSSVTVSVELTPLVGRQSTIKFTLPVIDDDGIFKANGVKYRKKLQRRDVPIRKVASDTVALTSLMSKMFVKRSARVKYNYGTWLVNQINLGAMDPNSPVSDLKHRNVYDHTLTLPNTYSYIASEIAEFKIGTDTFYFDYSAIDQNFPAEILTHIDRTTHVPISYRNETTSQLVYVIGTDDYVHLIDITNSTIRKVGKFIELLGVSRVSEPVNICEVALLGNDIPLVVILGHQIGLGNLLKTTGVKYRRVPRSKVSEIEPHEFAVIFEDEALVLDKDDEKACLMFNGLNRFKTTIRKMSIYSFDKKDAYAGLLRSIKVPLDHLKQYTNIFDIWIDHLTHDALVELKEPTDMVLLYLSALDKLLDNKYEDPNNVTSSVLWGYQRISGYVYDAMYKATRAYVKTPQSKSAQVSINPREVWFSIIQDQTVAPIEESNPIHAIKEKDVVVFRGKGGRGADTMTAKHRQFTRDAIGIISEANVDNGQVGTIAYLTADPNITSLRGTTKIVEDLQNVPKAKVQSTAMLLSPGSDQDDPKRVTFTNVMFTSTTFLHDAVPNRIMSGAERTVAFRTDDQWARKAKKPGKVININRDILTVEYDDETTESFKIGRYFGTWSGNIIPHQIDTQLKVGDIFGVDDIIAYNSHYFEPDTLNKRHVVFKRGIRGNVLFWEARDTFEDANSCSLDFTKRLATSATEKRYVTVPADHDVELLIKEGGQVDSETILCTLKPPLSGISGKYSSDALDALDALNTLTPKAKYDGVVEKIEVMYTGELDEMSQSVQEIVTEADAKLYRENRKLGIPVQSAKIDPNYSIKGRDVGTDTIVLVYYITTVFGASVGDKLVLGNQMKTIISNVVAEPYVTEDGTVVDIAFSRQGIDNRIVNSFDLQGTSNTVLALIEKEMINAYDNMD